MINIFIHWLEAWPSLIPLYLYIYKKPREGFLNVIALYLLTSFIITVFEVISWRFNDCMPEYLKNNNYLYNLHSIVKIFFFIIFLRSIPHTFKARIFDVFLALYLCFFCFYFLFFQKFENISSLLLASESFFILGFASAYLVKLIKSDKVVETSSSYLLIVIGLSILEAANFFVYLIYPYIPDTHGKLAHNIWYVPDSSFLIFCLFVSLAFLKPKS